MIRYKQHSNGNESGVQLILLWVFGISLFWTTRKGDHAEVRISVGPLDVGITSSIWWDRLLP
tara:strand:- start:2762 stop:2947 length:186 start_codon:yes stop_codon:yes gene_type:complete